MKNPNEQLLREIRDALAEAIDCWETLSPEAFCFAMKHLMNLRDRLDAILCRTDGTDNPCKSDDADDMCEQCDCWKATRANCS
jgi:hypothetical protein